MTSKLWAQSVDEGGVFSYGEPFKCVLKKYLGFPEAILNPTLSIVDRVPLWGRDFVHENSNVALPTVRQKPLLNRCTSRWEAIWACFWCICHPLQIVGGALPRRRSSIVTRNHVHFEASSSAPSGLCPLPPVRRAANTCVDAISGSNVAERRPRFTERCVHGRTRHLIYVECQAEIKECQGLTAS